MPRKKKHSYPKDVRRRILQVLAVIAPDVPFPRQKEAQWYCLDQHWPHSQAGQVALLQAEVAHLRAALAEARQRQPPPPPPPPAHVCPICHKQLGRKSDLVNHMRLEHKANGKDQTP